MIFDAKRPVLITGGAGFIGTNVAERLLTAGQPVLIYDSLARAGVRENLAWLRRRHGAMIDVNVADVRDAIALRRAVSRACRVFHFAAQVAVTTSVEDPARDFAVNAEGTINLLEAARSLADPPAILYTSTNKVYGDLEDLALVLHDGRWVPRDEELRERGISERRSLDFHSPYGCSKGAADQYVLDYARVFKIPAVVFRMSCIYGPHQRGNEDQGWLAHFVLRALGGHPITIYGDGRQVRDALYVEDLVDAMLLAQQRIDELSGRAFNMGGGPANTISLLELLAVLGRIHGRAPAVRFAEWRVADQRYYVSDVGRFRAATGWSPRVSVEQGVERLYEALRASAAETPSVVDERPELPLVAGASR
jgi:CDP-paratose 2-epimerase